MKAFFDFIGNHWGKIVIILLIILAIASPKSYVRVLRWGSGLLHTTQVETKAAREDLKEIKKDIQELKKK
jgi:hypothetical protein